MDTSCCMTQGRHFGGIGILWPCIHIHKYNDSGVMAIDFNDGNRKIFAVNVYAVR